MFKLSVRHLLAHKMRFLLTLSTVAAAVAFIAGAFMVSDSVRTSLDRQVTTISSTFDLQVRPPGVPELADSGASNSTKITDADINLVTSAESVDAVRPQLEIVGSAALPRPENGTPASTESTTFAWVDNNGWVTTSGSPPAAENQFVIDAQSAATMGFKVGQTYWLDTPAGPIKSQLTGLLENNGKNGTAGVAPYIGLAAETLQTVVGQEGYDRLDVQLTASASADAVRTEIKTLLPGHLIQTRAMVEENAKSSNADIRIFRNVLLGFGATAVFVASFLIYGTFSILVGQRTQEIGLLRALGTTTTQVQRSIILESLLASLVASVTGIGLGVAGNWLIHEVYFGPELGFDEASFAVSPSTIMACVATGVIVTTASALLPAIRASKVSPIAALRSTSAPKQSNRSAYVLFLSGFMLLTGVFGFIASGTAQYVSIGLAGLCLIFVVTALTSRLVKPFTLICDLIVLFLAGATGKIAVGNTARDPRKTATNSAALMVGLALVTALLITGKTVQRTMYEDVRNGTNYDYLVTGFDFSEQLALSVQNLNVVEQQVPISSDKVIINDSVEKVWVANQTEAQELFDVNFVKSDNPERETPGLSVSESVANANGFHLEDRVAVTFTNGEKRQIPITGIYRNKALLENVDYYLERSVWEEVTGKTSSEALVVRVSEGTSRQAFEAALDTLPTRKQIASVQTQDDVLQDLTRLVNQGVAVGTGMLGLTVVIGLLGIVNSTSLSIIERTREIGLLRAVGMRKKGVRRMVLIEALLLAIFGAVNGALLGSFFAFITVLLLPDWFASTLSVPFDQVLYVSIGAIAVGTMAALLPSWRAAKMDVLDAIAV